MNRVSLVLVGLVLGGGTVLLVRPRGGGDRPASAPLPKSAPVVYGRIPSEPQLEPPTPPDLGDIERARRALEAIQADRNAALDEIVKKMNWCGTGMVGSR